MFALLSKVNVLETDMIPKTSDQNYHTTKVDSLSHILPTCLIPKA